LKRICRSRAVYVKLKSEFVSGHDDDVHLCSHAETTDKCEKLTCVYLSLWVLG
jgi:hypothetical protein